MWTYIVEKWMIFSKNVCPTGGFNISTNISKIFWKIGSMVFNTVFQTFIPSTVIIFYMLTKCCIKIYKLSINTLTLLKQFDEKQIHFVKSIFVSAIVVVTIVCQVGIILSVFLYLWNNNWLIISYMINWI